MKKKKFPKWLKNYLIYGGIICLIFPVFHLWVIFRNQISSVFPPIDYLSILGAMVFVLMLLPAFLTRADINLVSWLELIKVMIGGFFIYGGLAAILTLIKGKIEKTKYKKYSKRIIIWVIIALIFILLILAYLLGRLFST